MRKLFVSFTAIIRHLSEGTVTQDDLDTGLFYLGCARAHAVAPWEPTGPSGHVTNELDWYFTDADARAAAHRRLLDAFAKAEADGRIAWRRDDANNSYARLNELLEANGLDALCRTDANDSYNYGDVRDAVEEAEMPLTVICR